ncbi:hypothetical protein B0H13DRAFT_2363607 [Mycena leptocephala]|nr:hypothetical protein B0H13DRAFT_2363607 [Mycena leptocephala]
MPVSEQVLFVSKPFPDNATKNHPPRASIPFTQNRASAMSCPTRHPAPEVLGAQSPLALCPNAY